MFEFIFTFFFFILLLLVFHHLSLISLKNYLPFLVVLVQQLIIGMIIGQLDGEHNFTWNRQ